MECLAPLYHSGLSTVAIAEIFGCCPKSVRMNLLKQGVKLRSLSEAFRKSVDDLAFSSITSESAYWAGFIEADGGVYFHKKGLPVISVGLAKRDFLHLEKLKLFLRSDHKIYAGAHCAVLTFRSFGVANCLRNLGIKTGRVDSKLAESPDFWRGVVDGDGSIGRPDRARFSVLGRRSTIEAFVSWLRGQGVDLKFHRVKTKEGELFEVSTAAQKAKQVIRLLGYSVSAACLDRKRARALQMMANEGV